MDVVDTPTRSRMMAGIRGTDTKPELAIRGHLHHAGFRFRLHVRTLPGRPDIVLPKHNAIVLVNGCFWHGHNCPSYKIPSTHHEFWKEKIRQNRVRDRRNLRAHMEFGWRVAMVWECALKGPGRMDEDVLIRKLARWIPSRSSSLTLTGGGRRART